MKNLLLLLLLICCGASDAQQPWPVITQVSRPWTRWWWMGSAVDTANIRWQLTQLKDAGFGGVEIVPIYGAKGYENKYISYLSPAWMRMLDYTINTAKKANMGVYISAGTGWPIGGPQVSIEDAATRLIVQQYKWDTDTIFKQKIIINDSNFQSSLAALIVYDNNGKAVDISDKIAPDGTLNWQPYQKGKYLLYALFNGKTGQKVKRAAPGGEGYVLDHFSNKALKNYLRTFDTAFGNNLHGVQAFYNDSYEVFGADWTPDFLNEFKRLRGYDLKPYISHFITDFNSDTVARLKSDYRETISDLLLHNFTKTFSQWSHIKKALSLNQAHGSPGNLLDLYAAVDIPECETFGATYFPIPGLRHDSVLSNSVPPDPNMLKFASSAAHVSGKKLVSCETFTWLGEHFQTSWAQCKPQVEQAFLAGVNHMFYHGTTYSPQDAGWPGWLFYASLNIVPNNSLWPHINALNTYIARCQSVLQTGSPDNDIAVYWPVYDLWNNAKGRNLSFAVHNIDEWLKPTAFYKVVEQWQQHGFGVDYFSDNMLANAAIKDGGLISAGNSAYKILVLPKTSYLPFDTWKKIIALVKDGLTVVTPSIQFQQPGLLGLNENKNDSLSGVIHFTAKGNIQEAALGKGRIVLTNEVDDVIQHLQMKVEVLPSLGLKFIRRKIPHGKYYYIVNHIAASIDTLVTLQYKAAGAMLLDPQTGKKGVVSVNQLNDAVQVYLSLQSGEAIIVQLSDTPLKGTPWQYCSKPSENIMFKNSWQLHFSKGGPALPRDTILSSLTTWTSLKDSAYQHFSGTGVYSTTININKQNNTAYILHMDSLYESARIVVNGQEAGYIWSIPYKLDITPYLHNGNNAISIEVVNLMANRIRYMDRNKINWKNYHEINFVNILYKPFDASSWTVMPSGIAGQVYITAARWKNNSTGLK